MNAPINCFDKPKGRRLLLVLLVAVLSVGPLAAADPAPNKQVEFEPDTEIQELIRQFRSLHGGKDDVEEFYKNLKTLKKKGGKSHNILIPNLLYYMSRARDMRDWMVVVGLIHQMGISDQQMVLGLLPYVSDKDELFRKETEKSIRDLEPGFRELTGFKHISFRSYANQKQLPPLNTVEYLYRKRPGAAVLTMAQAYYTRLETPKRRPIEWADYSVRHVLKLKDFNRRDLEPAALREAVKALEELSKNEDWWVRLYVAEILSQHPEFQTKEMLDRLKADKDELVRNAISGKTLE